MKELDLLLVRWLDQRHPDAPERLRAAFERLLEAPDPQLAAWFFGRERPAEPDLAELLDEMLAGPG